MHFHVIPRSPLKFKFSCFFWPSLADEIRVIKLVNKMLEYNIDPQLPCFLIRTISIKDSSRFFQLVWGWDCSLWECQRKQGCSNLGREFHCLQCNKVEHAFGIAREWIDPVGRSAVFFYPFLCQSNTCWRSKRGHQIKQLATGQFHWSWVRWLEPVARDGFCTDCGSTCVSCPVNQRAFPVVSLCELGCLFPVCMKMKSVQSRTELVSRERFRKKLDKSTRSRRFVNRIHFTSKKLNVSSLHVLSL